MLLYAGEEFPKRLLIESAGAVTTRLLIPEDEICAWVSEKASW
jgi:hypothetical protein